MLERMLHVLRWWYLSGWHRWDLHPVEGPSWRILVIKQKTWWRAMHTLPLLREWLLLRIRWRHALKPRRRRWLVRGEASGSWAEDVRCREGEVSLLFLLLL